MPAASQPFPTIEATDVRLSSALAAQKSGSTPATLRRSAEEYTRLGVFDRAISLLDRALRAAPADPDLYVARARAWRDWGRPDLALGDAHRAAFLSPQSAEAHNTLGTVQFALGQLPESSASFHRALRLAPGAPWALNNLCYVALMEGDEAGALGRCTAALERAPGLAAARNNLALVHATAGRLDKAREILLASGDRGDGLYNLGILLLARLDYASAADAFSEACRATPGFDEACRRAAAARTQARAGSR